MRYTYKMNIFKSTPDSCHWALQMMAKLSMKIEDHFWFVRVDACVLWIFMHTAI